MPAIADTYATPAPIMPAPSTPTFPGLNFGAATTAAETGARALIYRFPNVFGKWCPPHRPVKLVRECPDVNCRLYEFRFGTDPYRRRSVSESSLKRSSLSWITSK